MGSIIMSKVSQYSGAASFTSLGKWGSKWPGLSFGGHLGCEQCGDDNYQKQGTKEMPGQSLNEQAGVRSLSHKGMGQAYVCVFV